MVQGITLELHGMPNQTTVPASNGNNDKLFGDKIEEMLEQGVVEREKKADRAFISHLFLRLKNGIMRPIRNLSKLNEKITYRHFEM